MTEQKGVVERWDDQKGFGFISIAQGNKVFFHISAVHGSHRPQPGETVIFQLGTDEQGRPNAKHVRSANLALDNPQIRVKPAIKPSHTRTARPDPATKKSYRTEKNSRLTENKIPWHYLVLLLILPGIGVVDLAVNYQAPWGALVYAVASLLTYYFYWDDKRRAKLGEWRIPEANLHFWSLIGGWPGAFVAQQQFRHKTKKLSFRLAFWLVVIAHQVLWFDWLLMDGKWLMSLLG